MKKQIEKLISLCKEWIDFHNEVSIVSRYYNHTDDITHINSVFCDVQSHGYWYVQLGYNQVEVTNFHTGHISVKMDTNVMDESKLSEIYDYYSGFLSNLIATEKERLLAEQTKAKEKKIAELRAELTKLEGGDNVS